MSGASGKREEVATPPASESEAPSRPLERRASVEILSGASIVPRQVEWLWRGWIARGKLHLLAGAPGTGKTTIAITLAAVLTAGGRWPDGSTASGGDVLVWSAEDDPADALIPRLIASGGDRRRFHVINGIVDAGGRRSFDPSRDFSLLVEVARRLPELRLLILDPVVAAIAGDSHKNAEVRRGLQPLVDFASEVGCAALGISHLSKNTSGRDPIERITGSIAFGALPRLIMATAKPIELGSKRRLVRAKSNVGPDGGGFEYDLTQETLGGLDFAAQRIAWGAVLDGSARELLNAVEQVEDDTGARGDAERFLRHALSAGPVSVRNIEQAAKAEGIAWRTIERAKKTLGIIAGKDGLKSGWTWRLRDIGALEEVPKTASGAEYRQHNRVTVFGRLGGLRAWEEEF